MIMKEVCEMYYSIYLYKKGEYDCFKYQFKLPSSYDKHILRFYEKNKFVLQDLVIYEKNAIVLRILLNLFIYNKSIIIKHVNDKDYDLFKASLEEYKNEFTLFLDSKKVNSAKELYLLYIKRKIPFFVFYYVLKYVRFEDGIVGQELIRNKFKEVHMLIRFFKHFDEEYIKNVLKNYQQELILNKE